MTRISLALASLALLAGAAQAGSVWPAPVGHRQPTQADVGAVATAAPPARRGVQSADPGADMVFARWTRQPTPVICSNCLA